jgi:hypothetical protein
MYTLMIVLVANLILSFWSWGRKVAFGLSVSLLSIIYMSDFIFFARDDQKLNFYVPEFLELSFLGVGYMFYLFRLPERWCSKSRFVQLYISGFILLQIFYLNFVYESHNIIYFLIQINARTYEDEQNEVQIEGSWWGNANIFKHGPKQ